MTGALPALAVSGNHRVAGLPNVPTFDEAGVKQLDFSLWFGLNTKAGTSKLVIDQSEQTSQRRPRLANVKAQLALK
jgi:tripartite-type tricarboxylate transporter receptor subunit TctC